MRIGLSIDQLYRPQPGGIGTYVRGLVRGLSEIGETSIVGLAPRGPVPADVAALSLSLRTAPLPVGPLTRVWSRVPLGVGRGLDVVHATSMAGPFAGAPRRSATLHDLLWRDEPAATTAAGRSFHERRLSRMLADDQLGLIVTSDLLAQRLVSEGVAPARLTVAPLGADDTTTSPGSALECDQLLARVHVEGAFTLSAGTIEPRKNIEGLVAAHALARRHTPELGPLVIVGPRGWSDVDTGDAVVLGEVARGVLNELYRRATVVAYVPRAEGWGLPPVEALHAGTRVVASTTVPSVSANEEVELAAWDDVAGIADALSRAVTSSRDPEAVARRQRSVAALTWRACAAAHVGAWQ